MDHAWLDSLSEDWISEPRSSGSPAPSLPRLSNSVSSSAPRTKSSRIPKFNSRRQNGAAANDSSNSPLSERSANDHNIPLSQQISRRPSKLRDEVSRSVRGRQHSRTVSASTTQSALYHTIQHKSVSLSPRKVTHGTPEWKRRLLHGDVAYGEQRDLFSPAGLESLFHPPPARNTSGTINQARSSTAPSVIMPSSPPLYTRRKDSQEVLGYVSEDEGAGKSEGAQQRKFMKYKLLDEGISESTFDHSEPHSMPDIMEPLNSTISNKSPPTRNASTSEAFKSLNPLGRRVVSGQSDIRNEEFSPVFVAKHNTIDGKIDYAAMNLPVVELQRRLEQIEESSCLEESTKENESCDAALADVTLATDDYTRDGRFVNLRRGGYSQEGSFQKRMLSPSSLPAIDESAMLPEESMQASTPKELFNVRKNRLSLEKDLPQTVSISPRVPPTPHPSPKKTSEKSSSGSPLKLFGDYDTFTNQKLLRRLSQFEGEYKSKTSQLNASTTQSSSHNEMNDAIVTASSSRRDLQQTQSPKQSGRHVNSFGEGDLDSFQFSEEISHNPFEPSHLDEQPMESRSAPATDSDGPAGFRFQLDPSALEYTSVAQRQEKYTKIKTTSTMQTFRVQNGSASSTRNPSLNTLPAPVIENLQTPRKRDEGSEGKRLLKSPLKDPSPKRRRTLHETDTTHTTVADDGSMLDALKETHQQMQSVVGRKRKDARHDDDQQAANPKVLAMRQILRPRTPTLSQRSSLQLEQPPTEAGNPHYLEELRLLQRQKIAIIQAELDLTAAPKPLMTLAGNQQMHDDSRKGSVTTQDFLDEAKKIMAGIRGKARSGLTSLEESETENDKFNSTGLAATAEFEDSYQESTREPFSRPPSREGKPVQHQAPRQEDPVLLDHLRKYQEASDIDLLIASSVKSIAMAKEATRTSNEQEIVANNPSSISAGKLPDKEQIIESDPPNIRISENPDGQRKRKHSTSSVPADELQDGEFLSQGSTGSSDQSTSRSVPTGSSRSSDSRRVIAPHTVMHLIPEQLAGMVFDRSRNIWIKGKNAEGGEDDRQDRAYLDETEEDPFGDIPDLSVDETQELLRLKAVAAKKREDAQTVESMHQSGINYLSEREVVTQLHASDHLPDSAEKTSSENSTPTHIVSSAKTPEASSQTTYWGEEHDVAPKSPLHTYVNTKAPLQEWDAETEKVDEVEKEISIHEDRVNVITPPRRRNITISFSSPIASMMDDLDDHASLRDDDLRNHSDSDDVAARSGIINHNGSIRKNTAIKTRKSLGSISRHKSLRGHMFPTRPVSRIEERDEESASKHEESQMQRSISVIVSTPLGPSRATSVALVTPHHQYEVGNLSLTPLSEFTMHHGNESFGLDVSYIQRNQRQVLGNNSKRTLSLSIKELVEKITQVEPYEPFWEHMKQLDLRDKRLTSLHKLDEFCEVLEELDASCNQVTQLQGVPRSVRHLNIAHNHLSDLAAWGHLYNLQYVDVSNNNLESLAGFKTLIHLRGLRADNNRIKSLDGVDQLDGLLSLRMRGNSMEFLDVGGSKLHRLADLDLKDNCITQAMNIHVLQALSNLNLEENALSEFKMDRGQTLSSLKYLKLGGNNLESINVSHYTNLRLLYLDRNRLGAVTGLRKTKHLDSLSMREQQDSTLIDISFLSEALEVRKLFLSGNLLTTFQPQVDFLNLQYLELANCGLETLSPEFGHMVANTRVLNLNFNALRDIKPLHGILRLKKLHLAGNRLARLRTTTCVLSQFPTLSSVDLRNNPLTLGFYPPPIETQIVVQSGFDDLAPNVESFTLGKADRLRDTKYAGRLDMETKMLRRVFEILTLWGCPNLKMLDGLNVDRSVIELRDKVWETLVATGVLRENANVLADDGEAKEDLNEVEDPVAEKTFVSERWNAEDSFA